jgi:hypothetical protein
LHFGHGIFVAALCNRAGSAPQKAQNRAPSKIIAKHDGHATFAKRTPQCVHFARSGAAGAPH